MGNREIKIAIIEYLMNRDVFTQKVSGIQIRTRCPFCGDSQKNINTGHLYLRINPDDNLPIVYNCFKCPAKGILKNDDLEMLGIENKEILNGLNTMNRTSVKYSSYSSEIKDKYFEYELPDNYDRRKIDYLKNRLKYDFTEDDLKDMRVVTSLKDFLKINKIEKINCKPEIANMLERDYIGFLSNNNAHILFRDITNLQHIRWYKFPITEESQGQRLFYSIKTSIDLYTKDKIIINLSEGVLDCISVAYNLNNNSDNILNIAVCGKFYVNIIKHLISMGFVGSNICLNIYADRDYTKDTSIDYYRKVLTRFTYVFGEVNVYYNMLSKDCGVPNDQIMLQKNKI